MSKIVKIIFNYNLPSDQINKIKKIYLYLNIILNKDFKECIKIALEEYNEAYNFSIIRMLNNNPPNSLNEDGTRFWSGNKRCSHPLPFDIENKLAFIFVEKYAKLLAINLSFSSISFCCPSKCDETDDESINIIQKKKSVWNFIQEKVLKIRKFR